MKHIHIKDKLESIGTSLESISLGDFDMLGEVTAKRYRNVDDPNYKKYGYAYRANYERGLLIYYLIRHHNITSYLEVGFGRGYSVLCAAKAFYDAGIEGRLVTVDPALDEAYVNKLQQLLPKDLFKNIKFAKGMSNDVLPQLNEKFGLVYIDGDHSYAGTKSDWNNVKTKWETCVLFDDYHLPTKDDPGIQCRQAIDEIEWGKEGFDEPELIKTDRRIFIDERRYTDDMIDYGQVCFTKVGAGKLNDW